MLQMSPRFMYCLCCRGPWDDLVAYSRAQGHCSEPNPQHFLFDTFYPPEQLPANPNSAAASSGVGPFSVVPIRPTTHDFTGPRGRAEHGGPFTPAVFVHFSAQHIAALKEKALADIAAATHQSASNGVSTGQASTKPAFLSSNDVVSARMWQLLSKLPTYSKDARTRFLRVTDYRGRLGTPQHSTHHHQKGPSDHNGHTAAVSQPDHPTIPKVCAWVLCVCRMEAAEWWLQPLMSVLSCCASYSQCLHMEDTLRAQTIRPGCLT